MGSRVVLVVFAVLVTVSPGASADDAPAATAEAKVQFATYCKGKPTRVRWQTYEAGEPAGKVRSGCYLPWAELSHDHGTGWVDLDIMDLATGCGGTPSRLDRKAQRPATIYVRVPGDTAGRKRTVTISRRVMGGRPMDGGFEETGWGEWEVVKTRKVGARVAVIEVAAKKLVGREYWVQIRVEVGVAETIIDVRSPVSC